MRRDHGYVGPGGGITLRKLGAGEADQLALERLAERDSREPLTGPVLVAETEGEFLAAISLATGEVLADPFTRTDEVRALLELRAAQLRRRDRRRQPIVHRRRRATASLAGSPPGAGGRLISLPRWG